MQLRRIVERGLLSCALYGYSKKSAMIIRSEEKDFPQQ